MRIVNSVLGDASGGRWQVVCQYSRLLIEAGHHVCMLLDSRYQLSHDGLPTGVELITVRNRGHYDYLAAWRARRQLRAFAPELALAHCSRSVALLKRAVDPPVTLVAVSHSNKVKRLLPADAFIALTRHIGERIAVDPAAAGKPCCVIPNMIAVDAPRGLPARPVNRLPRIGALGRFDRVKGFDVYIGALRELKSGGADFEAVLGGAGVEAEALARLAREAGVSDRLDRPGWVGQVDAFLAGLDVLCVPARSDAFGLTPLQGAVAGVPLVLSRASGHLEMFAEETEALFCEVGDPHSTARQIARVLEQPALAERLRRAAYARVIEDYSESVVSKRLLQLIENKFNKNINRFNYKII